MKQAPNKNSNKISSLPIPSPFLRDNSLNCQINCICNGTGLIKNILIDTSIKCNTGIVYRDMPLTSLFPFEIRTEINEEFINATQTGNSQKRIFKINNSPIEVNISPITQGIYHIGIQPRESSSLEAVGIKNSYDLERLEALNELSMLVLSSIDPREVIKKAVKILADVINVKYVLLFIFEEKENILTLSAAHGVAKENIGKSLIYGSSESDIDALIKSGRPMNPKDINYLSSPFTFENEIKSFKESIRIPLLIEETKYGMISIHRTNNSHFTKEDFEFMHQISKIVSYCIKRDIQINELSTKAFSDELTGLPNKRSLNFLLSQAIKKAKTTHNTFSTVMLDIDYFKNINESLGHNLGDKFLIKIAERLSNILNGQFSLTRFGGDAFVIIIEDISGKSEVDEITQTILKGLEVPFIVDSYTISIRGSLGISTYPDDGYTPDTIIRNAEIALYNAKETGRNKASYYEKIMHSKASKRFVMEQELKQAIESESFEIYYQPIFNIEDSECNTVEALVRWNHPLHGILLPSNFVNLAEETGLIIPMGNLIFQKLCEQIAIWQKTKVIPYKFAVNLSLKQLSYAKMVSSFANTISTYDIDPKSLIFEITETSAMQRATNKLNIFDELKELGIMLSIDDFGIGYSSLSQLTKLPIDQLKIDQSFLKNCPINKQDVEIVKTIITLAHHLNLIVVAEGIENEKQLDFLKSTKCDKAQGFFLSPPLPVQSFDKDFITPLSSVVL